MLTNVTIYIIIGTVWTEWLDWFCINNLEEKYGEPFSLREKLTHLIFWPITMSIFIIEFIKNLNNKL